MKLLLAEDEVDMSEALVDILTYHKYTVDAVFDGEEALDYATIGEYDGIILDIMMPKLEYQLMEVFMLNQGIYMSTDSLLEKVWGLETDAEVGTVWVYISYLRKRLQALKVHVEIQAKRGIGCRP